MYGKAKYGTPKLSTLAGVPIQNVSTFDDKGGERSSKVGGFMRFSGVNGAGLAYARSFNNLDRLAELEI